MANITTTTFNTTFNTAFNVKIIHFLQNAGWRSGELPYYYFLIFNLRLKYNEQQSLCGRMGNP